MSTLISSLDLKYYKNEKTNENELKEVFNFHLKHGILFEVESILSCFSSEVDMMYDHYTAIQTLQNVYVHFPAANVAPITESSSVFINLEGYYI